MKFDFTKNEFIGEFLGTFILVFFGTGSVAVSVLYNAHQGLFQIGIVWGIAVTLAIYMGRHLCCAHYNPAVSVAMVLAKRMSIKKLPNYLIAQFLGAFLAGVFVYVLFHSQIAYFEISHNIARGSFESVNTAKMFGEYYIQPGNDFKIGIGLAFFAELLGTFILVLTIFLLTESCNVGKPDEKLAPLFIGLTVTSVICLIAPLTQAGLNPARDFGPRVVSIIFGWGQWAFPDNVGGFFWVYILAPIIGGVIAALIFTKIFEPAMNRKKSNSCCC